MDILNFCHTVKVTLQWAWGRCRYETVAVICAFQFFLFVYRISLLSCILGIINCTDKDLKVTFLLKHFWKYWYRNYFLGTLIGKAMQILDWNIPIFSVNTFLSKWGFYFMCSYNGDEEFGDWEAAEIKHDTCSPLSNTIASMLGPKASVSGYS